MPVSTIQVGEMVPDFTLETYNAAEKTFGEFSLAAAKKAGKWTVLVFYPADFTFVCATEFEALADKHEALKGLNAEVVTVSTDTKFTHLAWQREEKELANVRYHMGADRTGAVSKLFGVYMEGNGLALRGTFVISPEGKLTNSEVNFLNVGRNMDELVRKVKANTYLAKAPGEVCPAKWSNPGDKTLKNPGPQMVGRVHEHLKG
ncbi:MAG: peroxiredoxin [Planctomycetes bacterium]|nr:peroxiredoxin [Planctomycetota bacterium]